MGWLVEKEICVPLNNNKSPIILVVALAMVVLLAPASAFAQKRGPTGDEIIEANYSGPVYIPRFILDNVRFFGFNQLGKSDQ
jgi:hypothetical protein